jgi:hypothetical protein
MSSVNLTTFDEEKKDRVNISGGALTGLTVVLIVVVVVWVFLVAYNKFYLQKNIDQTKESYKASIEQLKDKDSVKVIDFHRRLEISKNLMGQGRSMGDILTQVESQMVPNVFLTAFSYDDATAKATLNCDADNFNTVAKQVYSFKKSGLFSAVIAGASTVDSQSNRITFPIELKI